MTTPDDSGAAPQGNDAFSENASEPSTGFNNAPEAPAGKPWDNDLQKLPESVRPLVAPIFEEWDANVTKRLQGVHSEYEPYKQFIDEWEPDAIQQAIQIAQALEQDPQRFYEALAANYGFGQEQGAAGQQEEEVYEADEDNPFEPRLQQHEQLLQTMAEAMLREREERANAEADAQLNALTQDLKTRHGEFDEAYVYNLIGQGVDPEQAVLQFKAVVESYAQKMNSASQSAPRVVGSGGGYPSQQVNPSSLNGKDTKNLVVQMLAAAKNQT